MKRQQSRITFNFKRLKMKKLVFAALMSVLILTTAQAQQEQKQYGKRPAKEIRQQPSAEEMAQRRTDRMVEKLALSDAQKEQIYQLNLKTIKESQEARAKMAQLMEQARQEAAKVREEFDSQIKNILSAEQLQKFEDSKRPHNEGSDGLKGRPMPDNKQQNCASAQGPQDSKCCPATSDSGCCSCKCACCAPQKDGQHKQGGKNSKGTTRK